MAELEYNQATALIDARKIEEATRMLESFLQKNPNSAWATYLLGVCHFRTKQFNIAESMFRRSIFIERNAHLAHYYLGLALERQNRPSEATVEYRIALEIKPEFKEAQQKIKSEQTTDAVRTPQDVKLSIDKTLARTIEKGRIDELSGSERRQAGTLLLAKRRRFISFSTLVVLVPLFGIISVVLIATDQVATDVALPLMILPLLILAISWIGRWMVTRYWLYERRIDFQSGILFRKRTSIWLFQIEDCWTRRSPFNLLTNDATVYIRAGANLETPSNFFYFLSGKTGLFKITGLGNSKVMYRTWEEIRDAAVVERRAMKNIWV